MNKELFTQGDWVVDYPHSGPAKISISTNIDGLEYNVGNAIGRTIESEANAALISQAPAMYRALKEILLWTKVKNGRAEFKTSSEQIEEFKSILQKANPPQ